jgi:3'(2'), 5'-bisphosphate nucleotidase
VQTMLTPSSPLFLHDVDTLARELARICVEAGDLIKEITRFGVTSTTKPDGSECSNADLSAQEYVLTCLEKQFPGIPVIAEEQQHTTTSTDRTDAFFLVDPLDGTRSFLAGGSEYGVNIALIDNRTPVAGAIHAPALGRTWFGAKTAYTASQRQDWLSHLNKIQVRPSPAEGLTALASHRRGDPQSTQFLSLFPIHQTLHIASSIKFGIIAQGAADLYVRYGPTMEWDTAAGHAILNAAGGCVTTLSGAHKTYGYATRGYHNEPFVAWSNPAMAMSLLGHGTGGHLK